MLVLSRQRDESIMIGDNIVVTIVDIRGDKVRLGINAPTEIPVHRQEVYEAGDAFYAPAGHIPVAAEGTEYVQFSPAEELRQTSEAIQKNLQQMQAS